MQLDDDFQSDALTDAARSELESILGNRGVTYEEVSQRPAPGGTDYIITASWNGESRSGAWEKFRRTLVFLYRPEMRLPEFTISPRAYHGKLGLYLAKKLGAQMVEFDDRPVVKERYVIGTANRESVKVLFVPEAIDALELVDEVQLASGGRGILAWRETGRRAISGRLNDRLEGPDLKQLLDDVLLVCHPFIDDPVVVQRAVDAVSGSYAEEARSSYARGGGVAGYAMLQDEISVGLIETLRDTPVPRSSLSQKLKYKGWQEGLIGTVFFGFIAAVFWGVGVVVLIVANGQWSYILGGCVCLFIALLLTALVFASTGTLRSRRRAMIHGPIVAGVIESVSDLRTVTKNDQRCDVVIQLDDREEPTTVESYAVGEKVARRMMDNGERTWVLIDPKRTHKAIWPTGWSWNATPD